MSNTPRTDAKVEFVRRAYAEPSKFLNNFPMVDAELARTLERENAALRAERDNARAALTALNAKVDELLTAIEAAEQDVGHRPIADIIAELGPAWEASTAAAKCVHPN